MDYRTLRSTRGQHNYKKSLYESSNLTNLAVSYFGAQLKLILPQN